MHQQFDVLIVGSGLAGLTAALSLAATRRVGVICKRGVADGATDRAQGGIAAVLANDDDFNRHVADTLTAGAGLCDEATTRAIIEDAPSCVTWLAAQGVGFTRADSGHYHLTREGGHSRRRIVHADDATGHQIHRVLGRRARAHPNITILENHFAVDLITIGDRGSALRCGGIRVFDATSNCLFSIAAGTTVLATGGAAGLYRYSSNPAGATGDGIAIARRAGCAVTNLEFIQFHPTCLYHPGAEPFLISEAVRGEGGILRLPPEAGAAAGLRFMPLHDERAELAPRDIVARAIEHEMRSRGLSCVHLDITHHPAEEITKRFPTIHARCLALGIDMTRLPIPVAPAAHFTCGGVVVDRSGNTNLDHLYAVGEVACTGLHGANRLASNSLLECVAMGRAAARDILRYPPVIPELPPAQAGGRPVAVIDVATVTSYWESLRQTMWADVGIVRRTEGLMRAQAEIAQWQAEVLSMSARCAITRELIELGNALEVASLIVASAMARHESRGTHHNADHPRMEPRLGQPTVIAPSRATSNRIIEGAPSGYL